MNDETSSNDVQPTKKKRYGSKIKKSAYFTRHELDIVEHNAEGVSFSQHVRWTSLFFSLTQFFKEVVYAQQLYLRLGRQLNDSIKLWNAEKKRALRAGEFEVAQAALDNIELIKSFRDQQREANAPLLAMRDALEQSRRADRRKKI